MENETDDREIVKIIRERKRGGKSKRKRGETTQRNQPSIISPLPLLHLLSPTSLHPSNPHYTSWHSDVTEHRQSVISLSFTEAERKRGRERSFT